MSQGKTDSNNAAQDARREQMLSAAIEVIVERGFPDTRIADVAERADVSPALVIYYFKTKDNLLTEALRYAEAKWYAEGARRMAALPSAAGRLEEIVAMSCLPESNGSAPYEESWAIWLDLWSASLRHDEVRAVREESDEHWRETIRAIVKDGQQQGEFEKVDAGEFAVGFSALLDGLAIQIALDDPVVSPRYAFELAMEAASERLGFSWSKQRARARRSR